MKNQSKSAQSKVLNTLDLSFRMLAELSPAGIYIADMAGKCIYVNPAWCRMTGLSFEEALGDGWISAIHPDDVTRINPEWKTFINGEIPWASEYRFKDKKGDVTWVYGVANMLKDSDGYLLGIVGTNLNISDRKKYENELKESEKKYRSFFDNSLDAILITSPDGRIHSANPAACKLFDRSEEEICKIGRTGLVDLTDPRVKKAIKERDDTGRFFGELMMVKKSGQKFPAEISTAIFSDNDQSKLTTMIIRDVTESKKTEEKLKASEAGFRSLFENSLMGISQAQPGGGILRINKAYADLYGYPDIATMLTEITKDTKSLYANPDDRKRVLEILDRDGYMPPSEFELNRRNGEKFWALVSAKKVMDETGKLIYLQAEHIDITARKKLEKERYLASIYARNLIEASLDPLVTINSDGRISDVNLATEEATGVKRENLIGSDFADYFTDREKARVGYKIVFSKGIVKDYPLTIRHTSGRTTDVLYNATLLRNDDGEVQGIFAAARDITDLKKTERRVKAYQRQLQKLTDYLQDIREDERSKIALNLHDDFGQRLTALNLDIAWLKSRMGVQSLGVRKKLEEMNQMIHESIESIREVSSLLRPAILYDLGLVEAFGWQLKEFEKQSGIRCYFNYDQADYVLDNNTSLILYRTLQESLTNIIRHSEATSAEVSIRLVSKKIEMTIKDNGKGINELEINSLKSMGITGMKERVRSVCGKVHISGQKEEGTIIKITVPLKHKEKYDQNTNNR